MTAYEYAAPTMPSACATVADLLLMRATSAPEQRGYTFLRDSELHELNLTYAALDCRARAIAATLQQAHAEGQRALLLYPAGLEFIAAFFGCLYAGVVAVPAYPPNTTRLDRMTPRLQAMMRDAQPAFALTTADIVQHRARLAGYAPEFGFMEWLGTDSLPDHLADDWQEPQIGPATLAFLQYTSGSTMSPKGVMVSHANLLSNIANLDAGWNHDPQSVLVSWLPHFHDMGLIYGLLLPIFKGFRSVLMPPAAFTQQPIRWLDAMSHYRATHSAAPNFAYDLCATRIAPAQREHLDLSSWRMALNGAEPVRLETMRRFTAAFAPCGFRWQAFCPGYGLAESTLKVTATHWDATPQVCTVDAAALAAHRVVISAAVEGTVALVASGPPARDTTVEIVDPTTLTPCAPNEIGEIWVAGSSVAQGYWNCPEATERTFGAMTSAGAGPFLRTGDLGFRRAGDLFITGRLKDLIVINGRNHYPQDIEHTVEQSHAALRLTCCAAFSADIDGEERLIVGAEVERTYRPTARDSAGVGGADIVRAIRRAVAAQFDVRVYDVQLLKVGTLQKTSSGKVQRSACKAAYLDQTLTLWPGGEPSLTHAE